MLHQSPTNLTYTCSPFEPSKNSTRSEIRCLNSKSCVERLISSRDTGANYSFVRKSLAVARQLRVTEVFYSTQRFSLDQFDAGAMRLVAIDLRDLPGLDGLIGYNFFEKHRVCFDYARRTVSVQQ